MPKTRTSTVAEGHGCGDPTPSGDRFASFTYEEATAITYDASGASFVHTSRDLSPRNCGRVRASTTSVGILSEFAHSLVPVRKFFKHMTNFNHQTLPVPVLE